MTQFVTPIAQPTTPTPPVAVGKPRKDIANIYFILDKSGSMSWMQDQAIAGFNKFISDQRELEGVTKVTLVQFNDKPARPLYEAQDIKSVQPLNRMTYVPDGGTALNDAVGFLLSEHLETSSPDETHIIAILTDGQENASKEYKLEDVRALFARAEAKNWEILFLGANMTKDSVVNTYGINASNVSAFEATHKGMNDAFTTLSASTSSYRGLKSAGNLNAKVDVEAVYAATSTVNPAGISNFDASSLQDFVNKTLKQPKP